MNIELQPIELEGRWLRAAVSSLERTIPARLKKTFVTFMFRAGFWDAGKLTWDAAIARVNECLRPEADKRQFLKIAEVWAWMRHSGQHELFLAMAEDLGYRVERIATPQRVAEILERIDQRLADAGDAYAEAAELRNTLARIVAGSTESLPPQDGSGTGLRFCRSGDQPAF